MAGPCCALTTHAAPCALRRPSERAIWPLRTYFERAAAYSRIPPRTACEFASNSRTHGPCGDAAFGLYVVHHVVHQLGRELGCMPRSFAGPRFAFSLQKTRPKIDGSTRGARRAG